jgi:hypothetical protein
MTDFTMCTNDACRHRDECFRFSAKVPVTQHKYQSYQRFLPLDPPENMRFCEFFIPMPDYDTITDQELSIVDLKEH